MWSDRLDSESLARLVEQLRGILPGPRADARSVTEALEWQCDPAETAEALWPEAGFSWLDQARTRLFANPLVSLAVSDGRATIRGPGGTLHLEAHGFDLLEAALAAWRGPAEGLLCGYLSYELGAELEEVPLPRRTARDLPDLYLALYDWRLEYEDGTWRFLGTDAWRTIHAPNFGARAPRSTTREDELEAGP